jgi:hypothetical protein
VPLACVVLRRRLMLAGLLTGSLCSFVEGPVDLIKCRLQAQHPHHLATTPARDLPSQGGTVLPPLRSAGVKCRLLLLTAVASSDVQIVVGLCQEDRIRAWAARNLPGARCHALQVRTWPPPPALLPFRSSALSVAAHLGVCVHLARNVPGTAIFFTAYELMRRFISRFVTRACDRRW